MVLLTCHFVARRDYLLRPCDVLCKYDSVALLINKYARQNSLVVVKAKHVLSRARKFTRVISREKINTKPPTYLTS